MNSNGSVVQSSRCASTTSRWPMNRMGLRFPIPRKRATRFFFRSFGPATRTSPSANPASRRRLAIASAAAVTLPTESVVLISMSCLKMSRANCLVCSRPCARPPGAPLSIKQNSKIQRFFPRIRSPQFESSGPRRWTLRRSRPRRQRATKASRQIRCGPEQQNHAEAAVQHQKHNKSGKDCHSRSIWFHQRRVHTAIHEIGQCLRPLENPIQAINRNQMEPGRVQRPDRIGAGCRCRKDNVEFINTHEPVNEADEIRKKQVQRRREQLPLGEFWMQGDRDDLREERRNPEKVSDPDARKRRQLRLLQLLSA